MDRIQWDGELDKEFERKQSKSDTDELNQINEFDLIHEKIDSLFSKKKYSTMKVSDNNSIKKTEKHEQRTVTSSLKSTKKSFSNPSSNISNQLVDKTIQSEEKDQESELSASQPSFVYEKEVKTFGWKNIGKRSIEFDNDLSEYVYKVDEPLLSSKEEKLKKDLLHLFQLETDIDVSDMTTEEKKDHLHDLLLYLIKKHRMKISEKSKDNIFYYLFREFIGFGPIDILMKDDEIEDISCDGPNIPIFIYHRRYESIRTNIKFSKKDNLDSFTIKLAQLCGKQLSIYEPIVDGKLPDGSRLQTTLAKTVTNSSTFTIRRFKEDPLTPIDLVKFKTMSIEMVAYYWLAMEHGTSMLFCGGTASGKTTLLNALSLFLPSTFKIVSVEDTREINLPHENWIAGTTRQGFSTSSEEKT